MEAKFWDKNYILPENCSTRITNLLAIANSKTEMGRHHRSNISEQA